MMRLLSPVSKIILLMVATFLAGCAEENICNMTPSVMPQNQSYLYTITMGVHGFNGDILQKSMRPYVIIDGTKHEMQKHPDGNNVFVYDYRFHDIGTIPYYFELTYEINRRGTTRERVAKSELYTATVTNKYIFALDANRGPIGARVSIVGCGLSRSDQVRLGERIIPAHFLSSGAIEFIVPPMECDQEYEVFLLSNRKEFLAGTFFIDRSNLYCSSDFIRLDNGETQRLVFMLDQGAPTDGLPLDVTTDIPNSIIMPEVHFMPGERTVSVNIKGSDKSAKGTLFVSAKGFTSLEIPLEIGDAKTIIDEESSEENESNSSHTLQPLTLNNVDDDVVVL